MSGASLRCECREQTDGARGDGGAGAGGDVGGNASCQWWLVMVVVLAVREREETPLVVAGDTNTFSALLFSASSIFSHSLRAYCLLPLLLTVSVPVSPPVHYRPFT